MKSNKEKYLKVVLLKSTVKSFSWNDGLFAIQKQVKDTLYLWKIKDGKLSTLEDGSANIICTSKSNPGINETSLFIIHP